MASFDSDTLGIYLREIGRIDRNTVRLRQETAIYHVFMMIYRIFSDLEFSSKNLNRTVLALIGYYRSKRFSMQEK
ncbi:hypothetical protein [Nostoc sp. NMS4]|uniref:hypothetical protein n=1 Tax=Nostoc sp. NMS4 TaxID=2815390 RepID=UPI0025E15A6E|nr:hypothetical protein [Nostoc sp. NMS4]MBN3924490.1 hypothetical protein [Nostoc sp. NMS4]